MADMFVALRRDFVIVFANKALTGHGVKPDALLGGNVWELWPDMRGSAVEESFALAFDTGIPAHFEYLYPPATVWLEIDAFPSGDYLHVYFRNISARKRAEEERDQQESELRSLIDSIPQIAWAAGADNQPSYFNRRWYEYTGLTENEPFSGTQTVHPDDLQALYDRSSEGGGYEGEARLRRRDGEYRWHLIRVEPRRGPAGEIVGYFGTSTDIHDLKAAESRLHEQLLVTRTIAENADSALILLDQRGLTTYANPAFTRVTGYSAEETKGKTAHELIHYRHPDGRPFPIEDCPIHNSYWNLQPVRSLPLTFVRKSGEFFPVVAHVSPLQDEDGMLQGGVLEFRDVTEEKEREGALRFMLELDAASRAIDDPSEIMRVSAQLLGQHLAVNRCVYAEVASDGENFTIQGDYTNGVPSIVGSYPRNAFSERVFAKLAAGSASIFGDLKRDFDEPVSLKAFGDAGIQASIAMPIIRGGELAAYMSVHQATPREWTPAEIELVRLVANRCWSAIERIRSAREVKQGIERYRALSEAAASVVFTADAEGSLTEIPLLRGVEPSVASTGLGGGWLDAIHPDDRPKAMTDWMTAVTSGRPYETEFRIRMIGGMYRWHIARGVRVLGADGQTIEWVGACVDIHETKVAEQELRASEERYRFLADSMPGIVFTTSPDGEVDYANARWLDYFGMPMEQAKNDGWWNVVHPDDLEACREIYRHNIKSGQPIYMEYRLRNEEGRYLWHICRLEPMRDENGELIRWFGTLTDIDEQRRRERVLDGLNEDLERKVRERTADLEAANQEMEGFNYTIAHDLRAPLRAIMSTSRIIAEEAGETLKQEHRSLLDRQALNIKYLSQLIDDLLTYSRLAREQVRRERVDVTSLARSVAEGVREERGNVTVVQDGLTAVADPSLLRLVLQNLIDNAAKFSQSGGTVSVGSEDTPRGIAFFIRDQGVGFSMTHASKLFQPFERLVRQDEFPGTGIGLANVKRIIQRHGGEVWAESEPGKGATFWFKLPE